MKTLLSDHIASLTPYIPGEQPRDGDSVIKLNTNENPYPPSPRAIAAIKAAADASLRLYPEPNVQPVRQAAARRYGCEPAQVFVSNGSDEVLAFAFWALFVKTKPLLFPDISYSFYPVYARLYGICTAPQALNADLAIELDSYPQSAGGVVFANPNAPTGIALGREAIERFVAARPETPVVVDEAYFGFGAESALGLIDRYPNLLVVRTLSKSHSLAGLRVGFAFGNPELISALERVKHSFNSYTVDRLAIAGAVAALEDADYTERVNRTIVGVREQTVEQLSSLGFQVASSQANFIFAKPSGIDAKELFEALRGAGILVRYFDKPRIDGYLRITIGTAEQMARFGQVTEAIVSGAVTPRCARRD